MRPRVVLFTRWPEPGLAKTRLIPALGPDGAAALHRRLTERTLRVLRAAGLPIDLRVTGADPARFAEWLGADLAIVDQGGGDLGARLARAVDPAPVLFVGADAPDLAAHHLHEAAAALARADVAIGPAEDGGYWLLGLARPVPELFDDMPWGTSAVYAETVARLDALGLAVERLEVLADLDRPEDLARWPGL